MDFAIRVLLCNLPLPNLIIGKIWLLAYPLRKEKFEPEKAPYSTPTIRSFQLSQEEREEIESSDDPAEALKRIYLRHR